MSFIKYQHLERFGTAEVLNIEFGDCYIFPKIDGTNASVWLDENGTIQAGSRNRHLTLENDNAGFYDWVLKQENIKNFLEQNPGLRLYGEWLVPHSLKTYRENAWRQFYVFDVAKKRELKHDGDHGLHYFSYAEYQPILESFGINYIPPIAIIKNPTYETLIEKLTVNNFLIEDGQGCGEGIVVKNYQFVNRYGRTTFAKLVTSEFKEKHSKVMGAPASQGKDIVEEKIVEKFVTTALIEKNIAKISNDSDGWSSKYIPRLLNTVFYDLVKEEMWEIVKDFKDPSINFKTLKHFTTCRIKDVKPELF